MERWELLALVILASLGTIGLSECECDCRWWLVWCGVVCGMSDCGAVVCRGCLFGDTPLEAGRGLGSGGLGEDLGVAIVVQS